MFRESMDLDETKGLHYVSLLAAITEKLQVTIICWLHESKQLKVFQMLCYWLLIDLPYWFKTRLMINFLHISAEIRVSHQRDYSLLDCL